jgi:Mrp family chromosome partitioning ATPase
MAQDLTTDGLADSVLNLVRRVEGLLERQAANPQQRILIALAGVPGSGKSTVSRALLVELASRGIADIAVVPMVCCWPLKILVANEPSRMAFIIPSKYCQHSKIPSWLSRGAVLRSPSMPELS